MTVVKKEITVAEPLMECLPSIHSSLDYIDLATNGEIWRFCLNVENKKDGSEKRKRGRPRKTS